MSRISFSGGVITTDLDLDYGTTHETFEPSTKAPPPPSPETEVDVFATPMPTPLAMAPPRREPELDQSQQPEQHHDTSNSSFFKRNMNLLLRRSKLPRRNKPNLESTRKIVNSAGKTITPSSQVGSTISTLTLPNTPSTYEQYETAQRQQLQGQRSMEPTIPDEVSLFLFRLKFSNFTR